MEIKQLTGGLGAEIIGADIRNAAQFAAIHEAFAEHSVIVIRAQSITPDEHLAFAERFGAINVNRFFKPVESHPRIAMVFKDRDQTKVIGEQWHTDHSYDDIPAMCSILHAIEVPQTGGDTVFASMGMAYEHLSPVMQEFVGGLRAWHSSRHAFGVAVAEAETAKDGRIGNAAAATQDALHPVVIRHPLSGRAGLYVNPDFTTRIEGLSEEESDAILQMLFRHCERPEFHCRIRWQAGDVTMWDNRATWHKAINDYPGQRRLMHRVTVEGCALDAA
ncbi:Alpha-ketoglutarate-dependent taurine dioxygenase [Candidatus Rhodobacter oscarellae]|uniref:Alpha-ketoglutarate-dependent taurine dioxygenase n=1 Tax=Candidatus Rhodobacter oscarellae TaxID=1675527 RepID=A0A0J9ECM8_9RHOB|nr:TauD/TfdA family dioxygenase [Candidatus Rhodobacter lobularis]KMW59474.1 Alpha-ketoglutarate-dependent taurine dioxygenase [Candidatus Rhodobacter lobularis]